ncbi:hypothetical protein K435DRAFT_421114 [Dendrothele bispora CBS 962.96]|uniref:Uncharacterized protein n=1 Tax=Dendrothele bispora (strain CBS 962.96) TaxID=1314807 RepID=A0A4V6T5K1_DENBC|nr:hypothetical protein K435DRAFT_421114 [Dendrothele bispora CBS 962.96]
METTHVTGLPCRKVSLETSYRSQFRYSHLSTKPRSSRVSHQKGILHLCHLFLYDILNKQSSTLEIPFQRGQDLSSLAYHHYSERFSPSEKIPLKNYVSADGIAPRRYEYLGPQPCIAGFHMDSSEGTGVTQILWWDAVLQLAWSNDETWSIDAEFDEIVQTWLPVIRRKSK